MRVLLIYRSDQLSDVVCVACGVCVCVCVCACVYISHACVLHVHVHTHTHAHAHTYTHAHTHTPTHTCTYIHAHTQHTWAHTRACGRASCAALCVYVYIYSGTCLRWSLRKAATSQKQPTSLAPDSTNALESTSAEQPPLYKGQLELPHRRLS